MEREGSQPTADAGCASPFASCGITAPVHGRGVGLCCRGRGSSRHDIDQAAGGAAAIKQRCGSFDDLDLLRDDGFDTDCVILTQTRHIERSSAVLQDLDAIAAKTANDRLTCTGTE